MKDGIKANLQNIWKGDRSAKNLFILVANGKDQQCFDVRMLMPLLGMKAPEGREQITHRMSLTALAHEFLPFVTWDELANLQAYGGSTGERTGES